VSKTGTEASFCSGEKLKAISAQVPKKNINVFANKKIMLTVAENM
jgi:hypothetical protein